MSHFFYYQIALPGNIPFLSEYKSLQQLSLGIRISVPFGKQQRIGLVVSSCQPTISPKKIRTIAAVVDHSPLVSEHLLELGKWLSTYYQYNLNKVIWGMIPQLLHTKKPVNEIQSYHYARTSKTNSSLKKSLSQQKLLDLLASSQHPLHESNLSLAGFKTQTLTALVKQGLIQKLLPENHPPIFHPLFPLNKEQESATQAVIAKETIFSIFLLNGVTGSGKTEVYHHLIARQLKAQRSVLLLLPEIGLSPQALTRLQKHFSCNIVALHSALSNKERAQAWLDAKKPQAKVIVGTRSAIFSDCPDLGLIVVDEEHDSSYKQQSQLRYSARDSAIVKAKMLNIPILLGSATPSLESLHNTDRKHCQHLQLKHRAQQATMPSIQLIDTRKLPLDNGLSPAALSLLQTHLQKNQQAMIYLNRRGFAPMSICHHCGWCLDCEHCDSKLVVHKSRNLLQCHHCFAKKNLQQVCPKCAHSEWVFSGLGTQRLESFLQEKFPETPISRVDRDAFSKPADMHKLWESLNNKAPHILVGTQMLAKGHDFPHLSLVIMLEVDQLLFNPDYRCSERLAQTIVQVSGRAGRSQCKGQVLIQTHQPQNPIFHDLIHSNYTIWAEKSLKDRKAHALPPYSFFTVLRVEAKTQNQALSFLTAIKKQLHQQTIHIHGPIPAIVARKTNLFRAQLLFQSNTRHSLQAYIANLRKKLDSYPPASSLHWHLDVDPLEVLN
jgi:primosomal protein N' (replication factor Y) (superfamily II helicase)